MAKRSRSIPIRVADGGRLITALSTENVGEADWTRKLNFRRVSRDVEGRREGWLKFVGAGNYTFDGSESLLRLAELVRPNGDRVIVGASRTKLKAYISGAWTDISGGLTFSGSGKRWQVATINGYLILNNAVDLPVSYRVEDAAVTQIKEMRQIGYARVGRICEFNGFLQVGDITRIKAVQLDPWMNGYASYTAASTSAKVASWSVVFATDHRVQFNVTTGASGVVATLPNMTFSNRPFYCIIKKVDAGAGAVTTSPAIADEVVNLTAINDTALVWWNGTRWVAKVFASGTIPATDPYGTPPVAITERLPWAVANSEFGEPTKWAPAFSVLLAAASATIYLPFVPATWVAKTTRVAVIGGGPDGATLGGQTGYEDGVLVLTIGAFSAANMGVPITLEVLTDATATYPSNATVTRWTDISTIVAQYDLVGDSSEIVGMMPLGELLVIFRATSIYVGRYTGDAANPFIYVPRYPGKESLNLPIWGDAIADIGGDFLLYPGTGGRFYKFDGVSWPTIHQTCDDAKEMFFTGVLVTDEVFVVGNPYTKEYWFCRPSLTFAYDYEYNSVSEIDAAIVAGAFVQKPGSTDRWFILATTRFVFTYGLVTNAATNIATWLRDTVAYTGILKSGLISGGLMTEEKTLLAYTLGLASSSPDGAVSIQLYSTRAPGVTAVALMTPAEALPSPAGASYFETAYQDVFFSDLITVTMVTDTDLRISQRIFELDRVGDARGVTRRET